jgi:hypothetical protein
MLIMLTRNLLARPKGVYVRSMVMNTLLLTLAVFPSTGGLIGFLIWFAILAIVVWAVIALIKWSGIAIPTPVYIILTAFVGIFLILLMARALGYVAW